MTANPKKTKTHNVTIPIAGVMQCTVTVSADADAGEIFEAACNLHGSNPDECELTWEFHDKLADDHVLHASTNEWEYEEAK